MSKINTHIYKCTTVQTTEIFNKCCLEIEVTIDSKGPPGMTSTILELLKAARSQTEPKYDEIRQNDIWLLAQQQWELGRHAIQWGILHHKWAEKLRQSGMMVNGVHINGWQQSPTKYGK